MTTRVSGTTSRIGVPDQSAFDGTAAGERLRLKVVGGVRDGAKLGRRMMAIEGGTVKPAKHLPLYAHDVLGYFLGGAEHGWFDLDGSSDRRGKSGFDPAERLAGLSSRCRCRSCRPTRSTSPR